MIQLFRCSHCFSSDLKLVSDFFGGVKPLAMREHVLLQVRGHFFAGVFEIYKKPLSFLPSLGYEPVLRTLQGKDISQLPFLERIIPKPFRPPETSTDLAVGVQRPAFVRDDTCYNLATLLRPEFRHDSRIIQAVQSVPVADYQDLRDYLQGLAKYIILDQTQIDAFALALTREVALIQGSAADCLACQLSSTLFVAGPPGTGKTYVGVQIVAALLQNSAGARDSAWVTQRTSVAFVHRKQISSPYGVAPAFERQARLHPILCICFTNHALDQFLVQNAFLLLIALIGTFNQH